jgi:hypothetical protein
MIERQPRGLSRSGAVGAQPGCVEASEAFEGLLNCCHVAISGERTRPRRAPACNFRRPRRQTAFGETPNTTRESRMLPKDPFATLPTPFLKLAYESRYRSERPLETTASNNVPKTVP